nr:ABC transporter permease [Clostridia bacterium]
MNVPGLVFGGIAIGIVFLYGSVGEIITEKSGHLNLGIPGIMCMGTAGGMFGVSNYMGMLSNTKSASLLLILLFGIVFAFLFAAVGGAIYALLTVSFKANQNVVGLAVTTFGAGFAQFFIKKFVTTKFLSRASKIVRNFINFEIKSSFGVPIKYQYGVLSCLAIILALACALFFKKTKKGLHLRAIGENPATADAVGINVNLYKYIAIIVGSGIAGLGGLYYVVEYNNGTFDNVLTIQAFGWLAVALVIFTMWRSDFAIFGSFVFGMLYVFNGNLTGTSSLATQELIKLLPYVMTIIVLIITSIFGSKNVQPPASLGLNYFREDR